MNTFKLRNERRFWCHHLPDCLLLMLLIGKQICNDQRLSAAPTDFHGTTVGTQVHPIKGQKQAERVKSIVEKAERDNQSAIIRAQDVRGDPEQQHKTFLRSFTDRAFLLQSNYQRLSAVPTDFHGNDSRKYNNCLDNKLRMVHNKLRGSSLLWRRLSRTIEVLSSEHGSFNSLWSQDVRGDPEQRHKTFLRSFTDRAFLLQRSKAWKRFGFVHFLGVKNEEPLARSLASIWIGSYHLFEYVARFNMQEKNEAFSKNNGDKMTNSIPSQKADHVGSSQHKKSYASSLNGDKDSKDDSCVSVCDLSRHVMGRVKDLNSIPNLRTLLTKERFPNVKLTYLGGMWVMIKLDNEATKLKLLQHIRVNSWFHVLQATIHDFVSDECVVWVDIEGVPLNVWSRETFLKIGKKWGETMDIEENLEMCTWLVRKSYLHGPQSLWDHKESEYILDDESLHGAKIKSVGSQHKEDDLVDDSDVEGVSETFFGVAQDSDSSLSHPPGFTPEVSRHENDHRGVDLNTETDKVNSPLVHTKVMNNSQEVHKNVTSNRESAFNYSHNAYNGGSILEVLDDMIRVLVTRRKKEWVKELNIKHKVNFLALQETKIDRLTHMDVKFIWGNSNYQYVSSDLAGSSGGVLCVWEATIFKKDYATVSDNFIALYGTWISNNSKSSSRLFNHFITSSGLVDVKLEGYSFTWAHPSATKMSKLDRFLVSEGIILLFPSITALFLDCHLSDHRPILLREIHTDYGPIPKNFDLKKIIRSWIKDKKLQQCGAINSIKEDLIDIDKNLDSGNVSDEMLLKRMELTRQLHDINQMEARDYVQKSKIRWAIEGDENLKFFHGIINKKRSQLSIRGVFVNGDWNTDPKVVKDVFKDHFATRFKQHAHGRLKLNISFLNQLSTYQVANMDRTVSRDEIRVAVWNCGENKSPGPDRYTFKFFRRYWRFIGSDLYSAVECFFESGSFPKGSNSSFIALIPKVMDSKFVTDFRPISLIGCVYKVVTKVLANRLATVISDLVFDIQSALVANRHNLDEPFILNELLAWYKRKKKQAMIFKLDFAKAYDLVRWDYLLDVLQAFGFGPNWLKQGDHLASYQFILIMESLRISFSRATSDGLLKGIQIQGSMAISHIFYVDDAVFIGEWSDSNLDNIVKILKCFFLASGLKINIQKSQVLGVGVPRNIVNQVASLIRCAVMQKPFRYLGVMVGDSMSRKLAWADTLQKSRSRLSKWKVKTLSIGGRLTLLKSVLGASPLYNMSTYEVPKGVLKELEAIRCNFFNGADPAEKKITWVSWDKVLASKKNGGLRVSSFHALNRALLLKWVWRFLSQYGSLWYRVIQALYGASFELHPVNQSSIWCSILRGMQVLISKGFDFVSHCKKRVGDDHNTLFWYDSWVFDQPLRVRFPRLFALETDKELTVASKLGSSSVDASFRRSVRDGVERQQWVKSIPIKINVFAWRARLDRLPTRSNLVRR
nr:RNA-directed DNA polymerase, eukaryota [Tanacetum cinerariifolium]